MLFFQSSSFVSGKSSLKCAPLLSLLSIADFTIRIQISTILITSRAVSKDSLNWVLSSTLRSFNSSFISRSLSRADFRFCSFLTIETFSHINCWISFFIAIGLMDPSFINDSILSFSSSTAVKLYCIVVKSHARAAANPALLPKT